LHVNGSVHEVKVRTTDTLVKVIREDIGLTGTKIFCNEGDCGSCTVLMAGRPTLSCMTLAMDAQDKDIVTIEGLADPKTGELHPLQTAFVEKSGMQCGMCTPGMILTAKAFLDENPNPDEEDVKQAMAGNLCRCGNYHRIAECVLSCGQNEKGE
jgi:aerobic carbon-monoxide dehydrogenase small subunit